MIVPRPCPLITGGRALAPWMDYGPRTAVLGSAKNGALLPLFLTGSYLGVLVALRGLWLRRRDGRLAVGIVFPLGAVRVMDLVIGRRRGVRRDRSMAVRDGARVDGFVSRVVVVHRS